MVDLPAADLVSARQNGLRQTIQGLLGEARSTELRADVTRATGWHQPHGVARLRCVSGRRRARCQGAASPFARTQWEPISERFKLARVVQWRCGHFDVQL